MSLITDDPESSPRDCSRNSRKRHRRHHHRAVIAVLSTVSSLLFLVLILWLTLRPSSPRFSLLAATATATPMDKQQNATDVVVVVDAAFTAHNPNAHATALYDQLHASASYAGVLLGGGAPMPPLEQPDAGDVVLSALLTWSSSSGVTVAGGDRAALLRVRIEGQLRWRVAAWVSGRHGLNVECVAAVVLQQQGSPSSSSGVPSQCATHVL